MLRMLIDTDKLIEIEKEDIARASALGANAVMIDIEIAIQWIVNYLKVVAKEVTPWDSS